jgi:hypothetical protein
MATLVYVGTLRQHCRGDVRCFMEPLTDGNFAGRIRVMSIAVPGLFAETILPSEPRLVDSGRGFPLMSRLTCLR